MTHSRLIRTTVTVEFRPPDAACKVPMEHYRQSVQNDMQQWVFRSLQGCQVLHLDITAECVGE